MPKGDPAEKKTFPLPEMKGDLNMYLEFEYSLFVDEQAAVPGAMCQVCGCECYLPGLHCLRCERKQP